MTTFLARVLASAAILLGLAIAPAVASADSTWVPYLLQQGQGVHPGASAPDCAGSGGPCPAVHNDAVDGYPGDVEIAEFLLANEALAVHEETSSVPLAGYVGSSSTNLSTGHTVVFLYNPTYHLYFAYSGTVDLDTFQVTDAKLLYVGLYSV